MTTTATAAIPIAPYVRSPALLLGLFVLLSPRARTTSQLEPAHRQGAPSIVGTDSRGGSFDLDTARGDWVVVNFFSTTCVPCRVEHPELKEWSERHASAGDASIVSVTFDDSPASVKQFFDENGGDWPVLLEDTGSIAISYGVTAVPESYLVDPFGIVRAKIIGGVTADKLDDLLAQIQGQA
jgi:cytochrome c biogenesis protein CcmG/thiol:disulfide interchange protein DsbE